MVAVPSVLPLETGMQIEVHYVWPTQFLIDCAVGSKRLRQFLRRPAGVHLAGLEDSPWGEWTRLDGTAGPHMLTQGDIGRLLRPFAIRSKTLWPPGRRPGTKSESGYSRQQFEAAWASYCEPSATPPQASKFRYLSRP